jgi:RNA polymerase sigma-70 factor (sigma-E family)
MTDGPAPNWSGPSEQLPRRGATDPIDLVVSAPAAPISFEDFVRSETAGLLRSAYLLTGSAASAEDVVQETLTRLYPRWDKVQAATYPQAYVRRSVVNTFLNSRRLRSAQEIVVEDVGDRASSLDLAQSVADSDLVWSLLGRVGERQRAALVLRYFHDWPDADIAQAVGCRTGTVRSLLSRGLTALRAEMAAGARAEKGIDDV